MFASSSPCAVRFCSYLSLTQSEVIKGSVTRALQLYNFIALGAVVHFLHNRRAVDDLAIDSALHVGMPGNVVRVAVFIQ